MSEFNLELGKQVLEQITLNPKTHHQADPQSCVMGWTVQLGGKTEYWCTGTTSEKGAKLLGISRFRAGWIYGIPFNHIARWHLARLVHREETRRYVRNQLLLHAQHKADRTAARHAARIEEETQRSLDLQAREQVRAARKEAKSSRKKEKVTV